jgi:hypothetical protein
MARLILRAYSRLIHWRRHWPKILTPVPPKDPLCTLYVLILIKFVKLDT